jgi:hypothetical protein
MMRPIARKVNKVILWICLIKWHLKRRKRNLNYMVLINNQESQLVHQVVEVMMIKRVKMIGGWHFNLKLISNRLLKTSIWVRQLNFKIKRTKVVVWLVFLAVISHGITLTVKEISLTIKCIDKYLLMFDDILV